MSVLISWRSNAQRGVTLSSSTADYVAISKAVKEIKFMYYLCQNIGFDVELPIILKTDNALQMQKQGNPQVRNILHSFKYNMHHIHQYPAPHNIASTFPIVISSKYIL
jgi:hypothetical protein